MEINTAIDILQGVNVGLSKQIEANNIAIDSLKGTFEIKLSELDVANTKIDTLQAKVDDLTIQLENPATDIKIDEKPL